MNDIILFCSSFFLVFALGMQSLNVNGGHYFAAFMNSFLIGSFNLLAYKLVPHANLAEMTSYLLGGPLGIVFSMWTHKKTLGKKSDADLLEKIKPHIDAHIQTTYGKSPRKIDGETL